jgi:DNA-binding MarR family transcriptional regulator
MDKANIFIEKLTHIVSLVNREMKTAWDYGVGFPLYHAEVHLLEAIKFCTGANAGGIARYLGITNGAVSQVAKKLMDKALIETYRAEDNRKEVFFRITPLGNKACAGHQKHHKKINASLNKYVEQLDEKDYRAILGFFDMMIKGHHPCQSCYGCRQGNGD